MEKWASDIKLRQLQYFLAVANSLHFTKAASQLAVTQPTLSHQIRELEQRLGCQLFDRIGRSVRLTEAGSLFRTYANSLDQPARRGPCRDVGAGRTSYGEISG